MAIAEARKKAVIKDHRRHDKDSGSPEVQIAVLTERIKELNEHLKGHALDHSSRRGLLQMVSTRNRLLRYLSNTSYDSYTALIQRLGLRK